MWAVDTKPFPIESPLIASKLLRPYHSQVILERPRLLRRFLHSRARIASIVAHAGFGKTVLLGQLADALNQPVAWYRLDAHDNDPVTFWRYLVAAFRQVLPEFGRDILSLIHYSQNELGVSRTILSLMLSELCTREEGHTLVLDDCHVIVDSCVTDFICDLLKNLPQSTKVLLASRVECLNLHALCVRGDVVRIEESDLCFTDEEATNLFVQAGITLTPSEKDQLMASTGGWPLVLSLHASTSENEAKVILARKTALFGYMASEILALEDAETADFIVSIAVLEEITPEYCNRLLAREDSLAVLATLRAKYSFLTAYGSKEGFRYHQLFREFCLEHLGPRRTELTHRAGLAAHHIGDIEAAVEYFLAAGDYDWSEQIITQEGKTLLQRGNWRTVERWLAQFNDKQVSSNPWLCLYRAQIEICRGRIYAGETWANQAIAEFANCGDKRGLAEGQLMRAKVMRYQGRYEDGLLFMQSALGELQEADHYSVSLERAFTLIMCGRFAEAERVLLEALRQAEVSGNRALISHFYEGLGTLYFGWGYPDRALHYFRRGMAISPDKTLHNSYFHDSIGPIYQEWGDLDRALEYLNQHIEYKESMGMTEALPSSYYQIGAVLLDLGDLPRAEEYLHKAVALIEEHGGDCFVLTLTRLMKAICQAAQGRIVEAGSLVARARLMAQSQSRYITSLHQAVEAMFLMQTGEVSLGYELLQKVLAVVEPIGARKPMCIAYSLLAVMGYDSEEKEYAVKALELASEMNYVHDLILSYGTFQSLLQHGLERGVEVPFVQRVLARVGEQAVPLLLRVASNEIPIVRARAIKPLVHIGGKEATDALKKLVDDNNEHVVREKLAIMPASVISVNQVQKTWVRLELLGPLRILALQQDITNANWVRTKSRELLIYLAHSGVPVSKDKILESLWPTLSLSQANNLFHAAMHTLRRVIAETTAQEDFIYYQGGRYALREEGIHVDKELFQRLLIGARHEDRLSETTKTLLEEAVTLYRGDYLAELDHPWVLPEQEYLRQIHNKARDRLARYYMHKQNHEKAIEHLELLVKHNPLTEAYYYSLMAAYGVAGERSAVRLLYQQLESVFKKELHMKPSRKLRDLYANLITL